MAGHADPGDRRHCSLELHCYAKGPQRAACAHAGKALAVRAASTLLLN